MSYLPGDAYYKEFTTANPTTGAAANADSLPTATANRNGTDDGTFSLTVANIDTGRYKITGTIPAGYVRGDVVNVTVAATVSSVAGKACVDTFVLDSKRTGDLSDLSAAGTRSALGLASANLDAQLAAIDADVLTRLATTSYTAPDNADIVAIRAKTDNLPANPAAAGSAMTLVDGAITDAKFTIPSLSAPATGVVGMLVQLWRRFFKKSTCTATTLTTYADNGSTAVTTQTVSDDGTTQTVGGA